MAQLVGQHCVHCRARLGSELGARFCRCGCPVHDACRRPGGAGAGDCPDCGASAAEVSRFRPSADEDARRTAAIQGRQAGTLVWYATDGWLRRPFKRSWCEDKGWLTPTPVGLQFAGNRVFRMTPSAVELVGPFLPWPAVAAVVACNALVMGLVLAGAFKTFTADAPSTYLMLLFISGVVVASHPLRWVRVRYTGEDGKPAEALFAVASPLVRLLGGTGRLFEQVRGAAGSPKR